MKEELDKLLKKALEKHKIEKIAFQSGIKFATLYAYVNSGYTRDLRMSNAEKLLSYLRVLNDKDK